MTRNFEKYNLYFANSCKQATVLFHLIGLQFIISFPLVVSVSLQYKCNNVSTDYANEDTFMSNLNRVTGDLVKNAPQTGFNISSYGQSPNRIYGLLQCTGNISRQDCSSCSQDALNALHVCGYAIGGRIWLDNCFLRYDNSSFFSKLDTTGRYWENINDIDPFLTNLSKFRITTSNLLSNLSDKAYDPAQKGFAEGSAAYSSNGTVYGLVQCWRDISINDCRSCLQSARNYLYEWSSMKQGAEAILGSCRVRFDVHPFFDTSGRGSTSTSPPASSVANPLKGAAQTRSNGTSLSSKTIPIILAIVGVMVLALMICLFAIRRKLKSAIPVRQNEEIHEKDSESTLPKQRQILSTLETLKESTDNFHESNKLGGGGFGSAYREKTEGVY